MGRAQLRDRTPLEAYHWDGTKEDVAGVLEFLNTVYSSGANPDRLPWSLTEAKSGTYVSLHYRYADGYDPINLKFGEPGWVFEDVSDHKGFSFQKDAYIEKYYEVVEDSYV